MNIALDATPLTMTSGGLPRYVSELTRALTVAFPEVRFALSSDQPFESVFPKLPGPKNWLERRWWLHGAERVNHREGVALFHGTNFSVPYFPKRPTVMTIHDLSPWMNAEWHSGADRVRKRTPRMIGIATMIITPSEAVRAQVIDRFHVAPERIVATPLAAADLFRPVIEPPERPYFLFVGTLEPRKNIPMLIEAWRKACRHQEFDLVLAGRRREDFPPIPWEPGLRILGETPEERLPKLYSNAVAVIYASQYEGFGLPVLEAMQCGAPVIVSHDAALTEVSGGAALQADTASEMAEAMLALYRDEKVRLLRSGLSLDRARQFSWQATASKTYAVYGEAMERFGR